MTDLAEHGAAEQPQPHSPADIDAAGAADASSGSAVEEGPRKPARWGIPLIVLFFAALAVFGGWPMVLVVVAILGSIFLHELGHFLAARWGGMQVTQFFVGMGPRLWSWHRGEVEYGVRAIPAGAFVKITGMTNFEEVPRSDEGRTYRQLVYLQRFGVGIAGSAMHFVQALICLFIILAFVGTPGGRGLFDDPAWVVREVSEGSAADEAGLLAGDTIVTIDGEEVPTWDDVFLVVGPRPNTPVEIELIRNGEPLTVDATIGQNPDAPGRGQLGIRRENAPLQTRNVVEAVPETVTSFGRGVSESVLGMVRFFSPSGIGGLADDVGNTLTTEEVPTETPTAQAYDPTAEDDNEGRVISILGIVAIGSEMTSDNAANLLLLMVLFNTFVGVFNLTPLLPFDGGHIAIATYEKAREMLAGTRQRYFADVEKLLPLTYVVVFGLGLLFISTIYLDIADPL